MDTNQLSCTPYMKEYGLRFFILGPKKVGDENQENVFFGPACVSQFPQGSGPLHLSLPEEVVAENAGGSDQELWEPN